MNLKYTSQFSLYSRLVFYNWRKIYKHCTQKEIFMFPFCLKPQMTSRAQSFIALKENLIQVIKRGFGFSWCLWNISLKKVHCLFLGMLNRKRRFVSVTLLSYYTNVLTEQFLHRNILLRHMLNEETLFISWWRYSIKK